MEWGCAAWSELPILAAVFLYFVGDPMMMMTGLPYVTYAACLDHFPDATTDFCRNLNTRPAEMDQVQGQAALLQMSLYMFSTIPPLILAVFFGTWSDANGRKIPMLLPHFGNMVGVVLLLLADFLRGAKVTWIVMAAFLVRALSGQTILIRLMSYSYVADRLIEEKGERGVKEVVWMRSLARVQVAESCGIVVGALIGWAVQRLFGSAASFCGSSIVHLLAILLIVCLLRDNVYRPSQPVAPLVEKRYLERLRALWRCGDPPMDRVHMWGCCLIIFGMHGVREGRSALTAVFVQKAPLSWPSARLSAYVAASNGFSSAFLFLVAPFLRDRTVIAVSLVCSVAAGVWMGLATTTLAMFAAGCLAHLTDCIFPAVRAILSKRVPHAQIGKIMSRISAAEALSTIVGPLALGLIYDVTVDTCVEAAFLFSAAISATILVISAVVTACYKPTGELLIRRDSAVVESADDTPEKTPVGFTQSMIVPSAMASGYGVLWHSAEW